MLLRISGLSLRKLTVALLELDLAGRIERHDNDAFRSGLSRLRRYDGYAIRLITPEIGPGRRNQPSSGSVA